jgi:hypothetical protein
MAISNLLTKTTNKRGFLKLMGAAPAASLAAKSAIDDQIAKLAGVSTSSLSGGKMLEQGWPTPVNSVAGSYPPGLSYEETQFAASYYAKTFGLPDFVDDSLRDNAKYISHLDPDVASKRSWSMAVKIQEQRQRNYERAKERVHFYPRRNKAISAFAKITGWNWPW